MLRQSVQILFQNLGDSTKKHPKMCKVFRTRWWMGAYGSPTPKRHVGYSNSKCIGKLNLGKLKWNYKCESYQKNKTTKRTVKGSKKQFTGVKKTLKASQHLVRKFLTKCFLFWVWKLLTIYCKLILCLKKLGIRDGFWMFWVNDVFKEALTSFIPVPSGASVLSKT